MMPRYCNRKGRPRTKQVVVERRLPLLANKADSGRIVQMNIISKDVAVSQPRPIAARQLPAETSNHDQISTNSTATFSTVDISSPEVRSTQVSNTLQVVQSDQSQIHIESQSDNGGINNDLLDNATTLSRVSSPTSISNLLDMALENTDGNVDRQRGDGITNFVGLLSDRVDTPSCSPSRLLKENDNQWINAEVQDFSFSSFLGHLDSSPVKTTSVNNIVNSEDTRMSLSLTHDVRIVYCFNIPALIDFIFCIGGCSFAITDDREQYGLFA